MTGVSLIPSNSIDCRTPLLLCLPGNLYQLLRLLPAGAQPPQPPQDPQVPAGDEVGSWAQILYPSGCLTFHPHHPPIRCRENYLFVCSCPKCLAEADEPNVTSEEEDEEEEEGEAEDAELGDEMTDV